jgi:ribonuclease HI
MIVKQVIIYTDGACSKNPGPGGWGAILQFGFHSKEISGFEPSTTNNRMELTAAVKALEALTEPCSATIHSDSAYLINTFQQGWLTKWQLNGWKTANKGQVENQDLWRKLLDLTGIHRVKWVKVKGHADNEFNNRCDKLAREEIKNNV